MVLANVLPLLRRGNAARIPDELGELRGPVQGTVVLPVHLTWHGLREFDLSDAVSRQCLYTIVLSQGTKSDIVRFLHPELLRQDWPELRDTLAPRVREACVTKLGLEPPPSP
jgi:hypothetical protein